VSNKCTPHSTFRCPDEGDQGLHLASKTGRGAHILSLESMPDCNPDPPVTRSEHRVSVSWQPMQPHTAGRSPCVEAKWCRDSSAETRLVESQAANGGAVCRYGKIPSRQHPREGVMAWIAGDHEAILAQAGRSCSDGLLRAHLHMRCSGCRPALSRTGRIRCARK
jgi:hypothetical protein